MTLYDNLFSFLAYVIRQKKIPRLFNPKTLTEKIFFLKLRPNLKLSPLRRQVADRIQVRNFVNENSTTCKLIPLLWKGEVFTEEVWNDLPNKFVIKANHGSKMVRIVDKKNTNFKEVYADTERWKKIDYYKKGREWVYKGLDRTILVEKFIDFGKEVPPDFKFFCLNGKVQFVQVDLDRFKKHRRNIYSKDFEPINVKYQFENGHRIVRPRLYQEAVKISEQLSEEFDFIRVDLYILEDNIYFGELTNFPGNCLEKFIPHSFDVEMGNFLSLNKVS